MAINIKKGDKVMIISGKDKGKTGVIERVFTKAEKLVVANANVVKKHVKVSKKNPAGGLVEIAMPMPIGKVMIVCPSCGKITRVGWETTGKEKNRVCKKCKKVIRQIKKEEAK